MPNGRVTRRGFLQFAAAAPLLRAQPDRPNIVFLLTDDQRWDTLGAMGNGIIKTPHLDRMAEKGVTFEKCFVTTSICMTSRASIFTGLYARAHGINDFAKPFTDDQFARTYPGLMRAHGYHTGFIGKYGVGNKMHSSSFDYWRGFGGQGRYFPEPGGKHITEIMGDQSLEFLEKAPQGKPFCLSVSFKAPHVQDDDPRQFLPDPATANLYKGVTIPAPKTADPRYISMLPMEVHRSENRRRWAVRFATPELHQESVKNYYRLISEVDTVVGRIRTQLGRIGADSNTVIVFTGDNGFYLGEHGLAGKWLMHEESIRVPLVVYDPRLGTPSQGLRRKEMALNIDMAPTMLEAAGIKPHSSTQGRSVYPLLKGENPVWRNEWFYEHTYTNGWIPSTEGIRTQGWKYTRYTTAEPLFEELFDLDKDPREERNLAGSTAHGTQLESLRARWKAWKQNLEGWRPEGTWKEPT